MYNRRSNAENDDARIIYDEAIKSNQEDNMHTQDDDNNIYNFSRKINEKNITFRESNKSNDIKK